MVESQTLGLVKVGGDFNFQRLEKGIGREEGEKGFRRGGEQKKERSRFGGLSFWSGKRGQRYRNHKKTMTEETIGEKVRVGDLKKVEKLSAEHTEHRIAQEGSARANTEKRVPLTSTIKGAILVDFIHHEGRIASLIKCMIHEDGYDGG